MMNVIELSDEDSPGDGPLEYEDIEPYLQKPTDSLGPEIYENLLRLRKISAQNRVRRVNANFRKLKMIWPDGTPLDYYIAFEIFANHTDYDIRNYLTNPQNVRRVVAEVENRKKGQPGSTQIAIPSVFFSELPPEEDDDEIESDDDDEEYSIVTDDDNGSMSFSSSFSGQGSNLVDSRKKYVHWTDEELNKFINIMKTANKKMTWTMVAKNFSDRSAEQCHNLYYRLRREKRLNDVFTAKREAKDSKNIVKEKAKGKNSTKNHHFNGHLSRRTVDATVIERYKHIRSLIFICGSQKAIVGPQTKKMKDNACKNPLFRCIDFITAQPLYMPAVSPFGTVLDYETWMQIMDNDQLDPKVMKKINSKSDIKILTIDNFDKYKNNIRNLAEIGYKEV